VGGSQPPLPFSNATFIWHHCHWKKCRGGAPAIKSTLGHCPGLTTALYMINKEYWWQQELVLTCMFSVQFSKEVVFGMFSVLYLLSPHVPPWCVAEQLFFFTSLSVLSSYMCCIKFFLFNTFIPLSLYGCLLVHYSDSHIQLWSDSNMPWEDKKTLSEHTLST
jgi:hypothetical protein